MAAREEDFLHRGTFEKTTNKNYNYVKLQPDFRVGRIRRPAQ